MITINKMPDDAKTYIKKSISLKAKRIMEEFKVKTLEGTMKGKAGDYLIEGINGELYPCDYDIFWQLYERKETYEEILHDKDRHRVG